MTDGILLFNKHAGVTSHDMIYRARRALGTRQIGHAGTLDPMAEGVLVVLVGRAAKACEYISHDRKRYRATLRLGMETDTQDITGTVLRQSDHIPDAQAVFSACRAFIGPGMQVPPMYSALKQNGQKLCDLARRGITVERQSRPIHIYDLSVTPTASPIDYILDIACSGGTYIRTLCADIGEALHCGGVMATLTRTEACGFSLSDCITADQLDALSLPERICRLRPTETLFADLPACDLPDRFKTRIRNGVSVKQTDLRLSYPVSQRLRLRDQNGQFFALGEVVNGQDGVDSYIRMIKLFLLDEKE